MSKEEKEKVVHANENYLVLHVTNTSDAFDPDGNLVDGNYEVRNKKHGCVEYRSINLPTALTVAEHYNNVLNKKLYLPLDDSTFVMFGESNGVLN